MRKAVGKGKMRLLENSHFLSAVVPLCSCRTKGKTLSLKCPKLQGMENC